VRPLKRELSCTALTQMPLGGVSLPDFFTSRALPGSNSQEAVAEASKVGKATCHYYACEWNVWVLGLSWSCQTVRVAKPLELNSTADVIGNEVKKRSASDTQL